MASQQPAQALASHLVSQTLASVGLLETLQLISAADASEIRARLPNPYTQFPALAMNAPPAQPGAAHTGIVGGMAGMSLGQNQNQAQSPVHAQAQSPVQSHVHVPGPTLPPRNSPPVYANEQRARALWDFGGADAGDLRFKQGDIVIVDEEVNPEWYRGRLVGGSMEKGGLFPANYVEKLPMGAPGTRDEKAGAGGMVPYQPPGAAAAYYTPPPGQVQQYGNPHMSPMQQSAGGTTIVVQDDPKKGKFGKLGGNVPMKWAPGVVAV